MPREISIWKAAGRSLSGLIRLAMDDLAWVERRPSTYQVRMWGWHESYSPCSVCLAGSVMARTLQVPPSVDAVPGQFSERNAACLEALDSARTGDLLSAGGYLREAGVINERTESMIDELGYVKITEYGDDPHKFRRDMNRLIRDLRRRGL